MRIKRIIFGLLFATLVVLVSAYVPDPRAPKVESHVSETVSKGVSSTKFAKYQAEQIAHEPKEVEEEQPLEEVEEPIEEPVEEYVEEPIEDVTDYDGGHLTPSAGVYWYGEQKETYYNLPMDGVVSTAHANGIGGEYWVRDDGCKMLGDYIIIACNREIHPYGSIVETSLGLGISLDTGGFAYSNPYQVDIAVSW